MLSPHPLHFFNGNFSKLQLTPQDTTECDMRTKKRKLTPLPPSFCILRVFRLCKNRRHRLLAPGSFPRSTMTSVLFYPFSI